MAFFENGETIEIVTVLPLPTPLYINICSVHKHVFISVPLIFSHYKLVSDCNLTYLIVSVVAVVYVISKQPLTASTQRRFGTLNSLTALLVG